MIEPQSGYLTVKDVFVFISRTCVHAFKYEDNDNIPEIFGTLRILQNAASEKRDNVTGRIASEMSRSLENAIKFDDPSWLESEEWIEKLLSKAEK